MKAICRSIGYCGCLLVATSGLAQSKPSRPAPAASAARYFQLTVNLKFAANGEQQATEQSITTEFAVSARTPGSCKARMVSQVPAGNGTATKYLELGTKFDANDIHIEGDGVALHFVLSSSRPVKMIKYTRSDGVEVEEPIITDRTTELEVKLPLDQAKVVFDSSSKLITLLKPLHNSAVNDPAAEAAAGTPSTQDQGIVIEMKASELK